MTQWPLRAAVEVVWRPLDRTFDLALRFRPACDAGPVPRVSAEFVSGGRASLNFTALDGPSPTILEDRFAPVRDPAGRARPLVAPYGHHIQERVGAVFLDAKSRIIREREIYVGTLNATTVWTSDNPRMALYEYAAALIVFHNHPSGDSNPSADVSLFTKRLVHAGNLLDVDVLDHLILGINRSVSLKGISAM